VSHQISIKASRFDEHTVLVVGCYCGEFLETAEAEEPLLHLDEIVELAWEHLDE
jgi:hypothetical protein